MSYLAIGAAPGRWDREEGGGAALLFFRTIFEKAPPSLEVLLLLLPLVTVPLLTVVPLPLVTVVLPLLLFSLPLRCTNALKEFHRAVSWVDGRAERGKLEK